MNIAEIESSLKELVEPSFDADTFIFHLLEIYGAPKATITKLRQGTTNHSKEPGDLLWKNKLFFRVATKGQAATTVDAMVDDPLSKKHSPRFYLSTDGEEVYCRDIKADQTRDARFDKLNDLFDFFLPLAGIERYEGVAENPADIKATARLAKLYDAILEANHEWIGNDHTHELNIFMTRMLFCFFAEDTSIFENSLFTKTIIDLTREDGTDTTSILETIFAAMNTPDKERENLPEFARRFPFVNGGLFHDMTPIPKFSKRARRLLKECGELNWKDINPDIFGSMIQAVVEPGLRGDMGMHYTSVPNIMKVLQPLFLMSLEEEFEVARDSEARLQKLLQRIYHIRVFDPACGSGNFLIIAYRELRKLESRIFERQKAIARQWSLPMTGVRLTQFFGIELTDFAAETAKLSLWIAEYQLNEQFKAIFGLAPPALPLRDSGNIVHGNACLIDWQMVCPLAEGMETYVVGNPPFEGARGQTEIQKLDIGAALAEDYAGANSLDYVCIWFHKAAKYINVIPAEAALVATNSICQGQSVSLFWRKLLSLGVEISFAHTAFKWKNNAKKNAAVTCVIAGIRKPSGKGKYLFDDEKVKLVENISPYLTPNQNIFVDKRSKPPVGFPQLVMGNQAIDGGHLIMEKSEMQKLLEKRPDSAQYFRPIYGANDFVQGSPRYCIWVNGRDYESAKLIPEFNERFERVREYRMRSGEVARGLTQIPYRFRYVHEATEFSIVIPRTTTEKREYLSCGILDKEALVTDAIQILYDPAMFIFGILSSKIHMVWVKAVAGRFKMDPRYSNTLVYNNFPVPELSGDQKNLLEEYSFRILSTREAFPGKNLAWLYDPDTMPPDLLKAHRDLDDVLEHIYIGRPFKNDTERLAHLFKLYSNMIKKEQATKLPKLISTGAA